MDEETIQKIRQLADQAKRPHGEQTGWQSVTGKKTNVDPSKGKEIKKIPAMGG